MRCFQFFLQLVGDIDIRVAAHLAGGGDCDACGMGMKAKDERTKVLADALHSMASFCLV